MKRTTIYLDPELEVLLKLETQRSKRPMADVVREAVRAYVTRPRRGVPPGAGAYASGIADTADHIDQALAQTEFGGSTPRRTRAPAKSRGGRRSESSARRP